MMPSTADFLTILDLMKKDGHPAYSLFQAPLSREALDREFQKITARIPPEILDLYQFTGGQAEIATTNSTAFFEGFWMLTPERMVETYSFYYNEIYLLNKESMPVAPMLPFLGRDADYYCLSVEIPDSPVYLELKALDAYPVFDSLATMMQTLLRLYKEQVASIEKTREIYSTLNPHCQTVGIIFDDYVDDLAGWYWRILV